MFVTRLVKAALPLLIAGGGGAAIAQEAPVSATVLEFADPTTLFLADSDGAAIFAYTLPPELDAAAPDAPTPYNIHDLDALVAAALDAPEDALRYNDIATHPVSTAVYISLHVETDDGVAPEVVRVDQSGAVTRLDLAALEADHVEIANPADDGVTFWDDIPASSMTVTDLDFYDGVLYISGLSTGEFASTLRTVPYPFPGAYPFQPGEGATGVEMYHAAHGQLETRAPIRAMAVTELGGEPTVIAAYTCTPLVTVPVAALANSAEVTGATIGELGFGNVPLEVLAYTAFDPATQQPQNYVLVINRDYGARLYEAAALADAPPITEPVPYLGAVAGPASVPLPLSGVFQADDQDAEFFVALRRDQRTGAAELVSIRKGSYMRLSDFISEYNFPDYEYDDTEASGFIRAFQNQLKVDEGYPERVR